MAANMNMDIGAMLGGLLKKGGGTGRSAMNAGDIINSPYRNIAVAAVVILVFILAFVFLFYLPHQAENAKKEKELQERQTMQEDLGNLDNQSGKIKKNLNKSREYYDTVLSYFGNSEDLRDLYQSVSLLASRHQMVVLNIKEVPVPQPPKDKKKGKGKDKHKDKGDKKEEGATENKGKPKAKKKKGEEDEEEAAPKIVNEIRVSLELKGGFPEYMAFKKALSEAPLLLSIHTEKVKVEEVTDKKEGPHAPRGMISVVLELSSYAIDKAAYQKVLDSYEQEQKEEARKKGKKGTAHNDNTPASEEGEQEESEPDTGTEE